MNFILSFKVFCINLSCIIVKGLFIGVAFYFFGVLQVVLFDVEFFVNFGDWFLEKKFLVEDFILVFLWCGLDDIKDIVMLIYDFIEVII